MSHKYNPEKDREYQRLYAQKMRADPEKIELLRAAARRYYNSHKDDKLWKMHRSEMRRKNYIRRKLMKQRNDNEDQKVQAMVPGD